MIVVKQWIKKIKDTYFFKSLKSYFSAHEHTEADDFMQSASRDLPSTISRKKHYMLLTCLAIIIILLIWASVAKVDEVTRGSGKIIPSERVQVLQHLEGGIVEKVFVKEGSRVKKGQAIMEIDDINYSGLYRKGLFRSAAIKAKVARLQSELHGTEFKVDPKFEEKYRSYIDNEYQAFLANKKANENKLVSAKQRLKQRQEELLAIKARINKLESSYKLVEHEHKITDQLFKEGAAAEVEVLRSKRQLIGLQGELKEAKLNKQQIQQAILEEMSKIKEIETDFKSQAAKELVAAQVALAEQDETNLTLGDRARRTILRSPVDGIIKLINIHTIGGIIKPGEKLAEIVPTGGHLFFEASISPRDVAFVHVGQDASIKLSAYDFLIYGSLKGVVENVSADSITDESGRSFYLVRIKINKDHFESDNETLPILPGMTGEVDILTGKRSVLMYLFKPLLRGSQKVLQER